MKQVTDLTVFEELAEELKGISPAPMPKRMLTSTGRGYTKIAPEPHSGIIRLALLLDRHMSVFEKQLEEHGAMHKEMEESKTETPSDEHSKLHFVMMTQESKCKMLDNMLTAEIRRQHPELHGRHPAFGRDGSIGWKQEKDEGPRVVILDLGDLVRAKKPH